MNRPNRLPLLLITTLVAVLGLGFGCADDTGTSNLGLGGNGSVSAEDKSGGGAEPGDPTGGGNGDNGGANGGSNGGGNSGNSGSTDQGSSASDASTGVPNSPPVGEGGGVSDAGSAGEPPNGADAGSTAGDATADTISGDDAGAPVCNTADPVVLYLSADDSNSMAGATIARSLIGQGQYAYKALRVYEFLNYYDFAYPAAAADHVAVSAQMRAAPDDRYHLQIGVRAPDFSVENRRRVNLVLAVDTSSSMGWGPAGQTGIELARTSCIALAKSLDKGDLFSLVAWGGAVSPMLESHAVSGPWDPTITTACDELQPLGATNFSAGLIAAYALAQKNFAEARINRVVLISDGGANVGEKDEALIAAAAKDGDKEAIYLVGVGVGDAWNYNDTLMNSVTDAGKGAYVFVDSPAEADIAFTDAFLRHVEVAARSVQVELTLPPSFEMDVFHGEEYSTVAEEVEPQHLAANDAMIFHQVIKTCAPESLTGAETISVKATWQHPVTHVEIVDTFEAKLVDLIAVDSPLLAKGDAVVAYAEALQEVQTLEGEAARDRIDEAIATIEAAIKMLPSDTELLEIHALLVAYRKVFETGQIDAYPTGGTGADPIANKCGDCADVGTSLDAMRCALELCDDDVFLEGTYTSPTGSKTAGSFAAVAHFGDKGNDLAPVVGKSYALMATGPATGTSHSDDLGGSSMTDPFMPGGAAAYNAVEWRVRMKAPAGANGLRVRHVFFSEEYDEYVGSQFNDKFYMVLEAGSTNGGKPTVINYTACRDPDQHYDFVCSPGMQFCNPRQRYCYIAINTAASECCWLGGCPNGKATTDISGTGYSCGSQGNDSAQSGSSTGWLATEWPIEPGEEFTLTFHLHDAGDGIYDSEVILDGLEFVGSVTPGTWPISQNM